MAWFGESKVNWTFTELDGLDLQRDKYIDKMMRHAYEHVLGLAVSDVDGDKRDIVITTAYDHYSPRSNGFLHYLAEAMAKKSQIVLEKKNQSDGSYIFKRAQQGYEKVDPNRVYFDFTDYESTDLLCVYFGMMYDALEAAARGVKTSQGLIVYLEKLSENLADSKAKEIIEGQILALSDALKGGKTGYASGGSKAEFIKFDIDPTSKAIEFCFSMIAGHFGLPVSEFNGIGGSAMSDTGESDRKKTRQAKERYFNQIIRPALQAIFADNENWQLEPDIDELELLTGVLAAVEMTDLLTNDGKKKILSQFGLGDEDLDL